VRRRIPVPGVRSLARGLLSSAEGAPRESLRLRIHSHSTPRRACMAPDEARGALHGLPIGAIGKRWCGTLGASWTPDTATVTPVVAERAPNDAIVAPCRARMAAGVTITSRHGSGGSAINAQRSAMPTRPSAMPQTKERQGGFGRRHIRVPGRRVPTPIDLKGRSACRAPRPGPAESRSTTSRSVRCASGTRRALPPKA
jgi:hypothetical protein